MLDRIADCIQTSVSDSCNLEIIIIVMNCCIRNNAVLLFEVALIDSKYRFCIDIVVFEYPIDQIRCKLFVGFVGYIFDEIAHFLTHLLRQTDTETLFQDIIYAALS